MFNDKEFQEKKSYREKLKMTGKVKIYFPPNYGEPFCHYDSRGLTNEKVYNVIGWEKQSPVIWDDNNKPKVLIQTVFDIVEEIKIIGQ